MRCCEEELNDLVKLDEMCRKEEKKREGREEEDMVKRQELVGNLHLGHRVTVACKS